MTNAINACRYLFCLSIFFGGSLCLNAFALALLLLCPKRQRAPLMRRTLQRTCHLWIRILATVCVERIDFRGLSGIAGKRGQLWIANHPSIIDIALLISRVPNATCIYKGRIAKHPFYGFLPKACDFIPNVGGPDLVRLACAELEKGSNLIVFPEGTRSPLDPSHTFKGGFALIAKRSKAPVNLVEIAVTEGFLDPHRNILRPGSMPAWITVTLVGEERFNAGESIAAFARRLQRRYQARPPAGELAARRAADASPQ